MTTPAAAVVWTIVAWAIILTYTVLFVSIRQTFAAAAFALAAFYLARELGVPAWRNWKAGDAADIAILVYVGAVLLQHKG